MGVFCIFVRSNILQMRRLTLLIFLFFAFFSATNGQWTIETVPNTRLQSNEIHISDPDDYLSDSAEMNINTALSAIRDQADVFVVTLSSIGEVEPKRFATQLFNHWGIGDAETNNGVLLLFVEDQHALEFETGYGAEETLTDAKCERIFTKTIVPYFRAGDYEGGLCAGVGEIVSVYGGTIPLGLVTTLPSENNEESGGFDDDIGFFFMLLALLMLAMPILGVVYWLYKRNKKVSVTDSYHSVEEGGATYIDSLQTAWSGSPWEGKGCLGGLMLGFSIFVFMFIAILFMSPRFPDMEETQLFNWISFITLVLYVTWICFRQNHRALRMADDLAKQSLNPKGIYSAAFNNTGTKIATWMAPWLGFAYRRVLKNRMEQSIDNQCPICHAELRKDGNFALPENHALERKLQVFEFTPYRCINGHEIVMRKQGIHYKKYQTCKQCGMFASKLTKTETVREASYTESGEKLQTFVCQHCGDIVTKTVVIPKKVHYSSSSSSSGSYSSGSSSSRSYSHSSSSRSSGSFGGGRSGGGGFSGRW